MNAKQRIETFLKENNIKGNRFIGRCILTERGNFILGDIISKDGKVQLLKANGDRITINATNPTFEFLEGKFYEFSVYIPAPNANGKSILVLDLQFNLPAESDINSKDIILKARRETQSKISLADFLSRSNVSNNRFYGRCVQSETGQKMLNDIISKDEGNLLLRDDGDRLSIYISNIDFDFEADQYYEFSIRIFHKGVNRDEIISVEINENPPVKLDINPYREITRLRYERLDNPEANRMIAHLMREIGKGLYSSKQRMIFELLQNADDTPAGDIVSFHIDAYYDYFLVMHNGVPFNQDDVEAITSAAESTKRNDKKKTGYKGIGFKSVFTDSEEVIIKSGGFLFTFKRNHTAYNNFDTFYFGKKRYQEYPALLEEDKLKYAKQRRTFNGNTDIPWQLIPIWLEELPQELNESRLAKYNNNVGFAIKFGREKVQDYLEAVNYFVEKPHFMLFLRHVNLFKSFKNAVTVRKSGEEIVTIEKITLNGENLKLIYYKHLIDDIPVNDMALSEEGIDIYKKEKVNEYGEVSHYFSSDEEGKQVIESIPPKLAAFEVTTISFAAPIVNGNIACEPSYLSGKAFSSFFTYLPMKETRIQLPFLVNADFVPSSNREELQGDNQWNEYIISKIAFNHIRFLRQIANQSIESGRFEPEYLSLLLSKLLEDDSSIQLLIRKYNEVYTQSLQVVPFIISDKESLITLSEVILDATGISDVLGSNLFYQITATEKHLPHPSINAKYLNYAYLQIDKYSSINLVADLSEEGNLEVLKQELSALESKRYLNFLKWLNEFCQLYVEDSEWVLTFPFIVVDGICSSFNDILAADDVFIRSYRTRPIESLLAKLGFKLSSFYIDDYKHLFEKSWLIDSYLHKDIKLYERIASNAHLSLLSPTEKANLISFIASLKGIGEVKFANNLPLFNTQVEQVGLKPLASLITNKCVGLPKWLLKFVIKEEEENALSQEFRNYLIDESNILELLFCNSVLFEEITTGLSSTDIESLYAYVLKLHSELPADKELPYTGIPWLYVPTLQVFQLPSAVYCPDSLLKLPVEKYKAVCFVIEGITDEYTAHSFSLPLIEKFSLGCKKGAIAKLITKSSKHSVEQSNDFLDWASTNGDNSLLEVLQFQKDDAEIAFNHVASCKTYYTSDTELISLIEDSPIAKSTLYLLPSELYDNARSKIGLMEGEQLINHLLEIGFAKPSFVTHVRKVKNEDTSRLFIAKLESIDLSSEMVYNKDSSEHLLFELIIDLGKEDDKYFDSLISKITIDGHGLAKKNISDEVVFRFAATDTIAERRYVLKLSEILPSYKDETAALTKVIGNFVDIKNTGTLRKVFKTSQKRTEDIFNELHSTQADYLSPHQVMFMLLYQEDKPKLDFKKGKPDFSEYYFETNKSEYETQCIDFISLLFAHKYPYFKGRFHFKDLTLNNTILDNDYAIDKEIAPTWLQRWINDEDKEPKLSFLNLSGLNKADSPIMLLRKGLAENNREIFQKGLVNLDNPILLSNTMQWLLKLQTEKETKYDKIFLKDLYAKLEEKKLLGVDVPLAVMVQLDPESYKLLVKTEDSIFHTLNAGWGDYSAEIFASIIASGGHVIDDVLPQSLHKFLKSTNEKALIATDGEEILGNSSLFSEPYYTKWQYSAQYPIYIYNGELLPNKLTYSTIFTRSIFQGKVSVVNNTYYVTSDTADELPYPLKGILPNNIYSDLINVKDEYQNKKHKEQYEISYSDEEANALKRLFGDEIPRGFHKDLNLASLIKGLIYLSNSGYDVTEAEEQLKNTHEYSQLYPVYKEGVERGIANALKIKCRSAKSGLLYLRASSWQELENSNTYLYILTGNDNTDCRFCTTREEVIQDSKADYRVLRIEAGNGVSDIDDIIEGKFDPENLWLIIRMSDKKEYKAIFEKIRNSESSDTIWNVNIGNESDD